MRRSLFACSALALALTLSACQQGEPTPAEPTPVATPTKPAAPPSTPVTPFPAKEPQASIPEGPDMAPRPVPVTETPCSETLGVAQADRLVKICRNVSPATRPPCNAANPCALIQNEIDRSCAMYSPGETKPAECAD
jgi:hypothetical protein